MAPIDIVLLGGGHAHVEVLRRWARRPVPGARVTLIGREALTPYSGMLPGVIRGDYAANEACIDLARLSALCGARLIVAEATGLDLDRRHVRFTDRPSIEFDLLSIDVGGAPDAGPGGTAVKPIGQFLDTLGGLPAGGRTAVIGAGPGGAELALALAWGGRSGRIALVCDGDGPIPSAPSRARAAVSAALTQAGVETLRHVRAGAFRDGRLALSDGTAIEATAALWATGARGPAWLAASGLCCAPDGSVLTGTTLQSVSHPSVFAAGDCAAIQGAPRPKAGVWAVRAGPMLAKNLARAAQGHRLDRWHPQASALVIMGLGGGRAVAWRGGFCVAGRLVWRWKDRIDRSWIARFPGPVAP